MLRSVAGEATAVSLTSGTRQGVYDGDCVLGPTELAEAALREPGPSVECPQRIQVARSAQGLSPLSNP